MLFQLGQILVTSGVNAKMGAETEFCNFCGDCIGRHVTGDWGDLDAEDKAANDAAVQHGGRTFSAYIYKKDGTKIWIITEWDRSATTILFPDEY